MLLASDTPMYFTHTGTYLVKISEKERAEVKFSSGKLRSNSKMPDTEIIFRFLVEIRRNTKLRFLKSAVQHWQWRLCESFEDIHSCHLARAKLRINVNEIRSSSNIGSERNSYKSDFHTTFGAWRCSQFGDQMKISWSENFSLRALQVVSNFAWYQTYQNWGGRWVGE